MTGHVRRNTHLEKALATIAIPELAHKALGNLVGVYELRLGDAHLPSSKIIEAFTLAGVDPAAPPLKQGIQLIDGAAFSLWMVLKLILEHLKHREQVPAHEL